MEKNLLGLIIELKKGCMEDEKHIRTLCHVSLAEYKAVMEINTTEKITCNVLSKKMGLSPSRGSRIIDGLVRKKYLIRMTNSEDRRSFVLSLSSKGTKIKEQIQRERNNCERRMLLFLSFLSLPSLDTQYYILDTIFSSILVDKENTIIWLLPKKYPYFINSIRQYQPTYLNYLLIAP